MPAFDMVFVHLGHPKNRAQSLLAYALLLLAVSTIIGPITKASYKARECFDYNAMMALILDCFLSKGIFRAAI